jgi:superfamily II RNA helicase
LTEAYEGSIIRATRRLDELMGQLQASPDKLISRGGIADDTLKAMEASPLPVDAADV